MCLICVHYNQQKMTRDEAREAMREMSDMDPKHREELRQRLLLDELAETSQLMGMYDDLDNPRKQ